MMFKPFTLNKCCERGVRCVARGRLDLEHDVRNLSYIIGVANEAFEALRWGKPCLEHDALNNSETIASV